MKLEFFGDDADLYRVKKRYLYDPSLKIIVFDYDDLVMLHKKCYKNGLRTKEINHRYHKQASQVVEHAIKFFDKVVFWSLSNREVLTNLENFPYSEANLRILGGELKYEKAVKDLRILSKNIFNIVAIENKPKENEIDEKGLPLAGFYPRSRVIEVGEHENLMMKYKKAFRMLR